LSGRPQITGSRFSLFDEVPGGNEQVGGSFSYATSFSSEFSLHAFCFAGQGCRFIAEPSVNTLLKKLWQTA
jgi:hypothetical protein